jgi:hypothetical protein
MTVLQFRSKKTNTDSDINELLTIATDMRKYSSNKDGFTSNFTTLISAKIMDTLIDNKMIEKESLLCGIYISGLLGTLFKTQPKHWIVVDYIIEGSKNNNPLTIQQGANVCFLICSIFQEKRGRCMNVKDYESLGSGLYMQYYHQTDKEIGYYMAKKFSEMTMVTKECIDTI